MTKKTVVISCVTFETVMISSPAAEYKADEVHLFHYSRPDIPRTTVYSEFYDETVRQINENLPRAIVVEHSESPVYDFRLMLRDILACIDEIKSRIEDVEIFINTSAGTSEFIAAGVIAAMMSNGAASAFNVRTTEFTVAGEENLRKAYYKDGRPVGLSSAVRSPSPLPYFRIDRPDENLVRGLRLYVQIKESGRPSTAAAVIEEMKAKGIWQYVPADFGDKTDSKQKEVMYYQRHFINGWETLGWILRPSRKARVTLTPAGRNVIDMFYLD